MATAEAKTESKEVGENIEPLKYKTWNLKVSIHCEACKRKVKKVLQSVEGVYETNIDLKQQKATVKGNVEAETLIRKLLKTGKHAELWPEKVDSKQEKKGKSKKKEKQRSDSESSEESSSHGGDREKEKEKEKAKLEVQIQDPAKNGEGSSTSKSIDAGNISKACEANPPAKNSGNGQQQVKELKSEVKQTVTLPAVSQSPAGDKKSGGNGGKKKKKKGNKGGNSSTNTFENEGGEHSSNAPACTESPPDGRHEYGPHPISVTIPLPTNHIPPHHHSYQYPPHYYAPPVYAVNYSTANPTRSYGASYYTSPPPYSYAYVHSGIRAESDPPSSDYESYTSQPSDSFELFSDENPNGCSIM